jgi:hypothetical protein
MKRREFIAGLGGAAVWPVAAWTQQRAFPVISVLGSASPEATANLLAAFRQGLSDTGYVEGRNVALAAREARSALRAAIKCRPPRFAHWRGPHGPCTALPLRPALYWSCRASQPTVMGELEGHRGRQRRLRTLWSVSLAFSHVVSSTDRAHRNAGSRFRSAQ